MADTLDDLLRAADRGVPIGTTQRYFKPGKPEPTPQPAPSPAPPQPATPAETEKDMIDRILGRKKQSMSDAPGGLAAGQQYAQADTSSAAPGRAMTEYEITTPDGQSYVVTAPAGVPTEQVLATAYREAQKMGMAFKPEPHASTPEGQGLLDSFRRFQEKNKAAQARLEHPALKAVEGALPSAVTAATIPLTAGGGALASKLIPQAPKVAAAAGRALTQGVIGGAEAATEGRSPIKAGALETATSLLTEGILGGVPKVKIPYLTKSINDIAGEFTNLKDEFAKRAKAYKAATDAVASAFDAIKPRLPSGKWMYVPAISAKKIASDEAKAGLEKLEGPAYEAARQQILAELGALDKRAAKSATIGQNLYTKPEFATRTSAHRFTPKPVEATPGMVKAEKAQTALRDPFVRATADTATTQNKVEGVPFGALAAAAAMESAPVLRHIPGGRLLEHATEEAGGGGG